MTGLIDVVVFRTSLSSASYIIYIIFPHQFIMFIWTVNLSNRKRQLKRQICNNYCSTVRLILLLGTSFRYECNLSPMDVVFSSLEYISRNEIFQRRGSSTFHRRGMSYRILNKQSFAEHQNCEQIYQLRLFSEWFAFKPSITTISYLFHLQIFSNAKMLLCCREVQYKIKVD